ncbi:MAG: Mce-associated rane protein [Pseudonocardiales bacterium]|nr:Mce-associated rane protein [Pseudonocardiales bacterium]
MPVREIRNDRAVVRRRVLRVREVRRQIPPPDEATPAPDSESKAQPKTRRPPRRSPRRARPRLPSRQVIIAVVLLVAVLVALAVTGQRWYQQQRLESARQAALAAAKQTTVDFVSISAATVDKDLQRISAGATGGFKDEFTKGLTQVRTAVVENKVSSTGTVLRAALVSSDLDSAVVLVAVDASVKNKGAPDGRISHYRIQVDMALDPNSGRWLVSRLQFVG